MENGKENRTEFTGFFRINMFILKKPVNLVHFLLCVLFT